MIFHLRIVSKTVMVFCRCNVSETYKIQISSAKGSFFAPSVVLVLKESILYISVGFGAESARFVACLQFVAVVCKLLSLFRQGGRGRLRNLKRILICIKNCRFFATELSNQKVSFVLFH